jgi:peptidyl-prolyl cis-trans isomerase SurA
MKSFSYLFFAIFLVCTSSFAQSTAKTKITGLDHIVAVVNDEVILKSELDVYLNTVTKRLRSQNIKLPARDVLLKKALDSLVLQTLQLQMAQKSGVRVNDDILNRALKSIAAKNNLSLNGLRLALEAENVSFEKFREDIRKEMIIARLQQRAVINRIQISNQEINDFLAKQKNRLQRNRLFKFSHILIALPDAASPEVIKQKRAKALDVLKKLQGGADFAQMAVEVSEGQKALQGGEYDWMPAAKVPTLFSNELAKMKEGSISPLIRSPSGFHILKLHGIKGETRHIVKQTMLRHILLRKNELIPGEQQKNRLLQLKARIESGEDFSLLAKAHSDDTLSARKGGNLGWVGPGDTVPQFEKAYLTLTKGQISEPFQTRYGWHIVQVLDRREHDDTEKYLRASAKKIIRSQKAQEQLQIWKRRLRDEAYVEYRLNQR